MKKGWEYRKLGEFIEEFSARDKGKGYPVYSVTNTKGFCQEFFGKNVASEDTSNYKVVPRGCFAYNPSRINVGSVAWQNEEENVSVSPLYVVFSVSPKLRKDFLLYYIKSNYSMAFINALSRGAVRNNLRLSTLKTFKIPYASVSMQQHVVEELDLLSSIIEKKKALLNELDNLAQSLFYEMFGDPITNEKGWDVKTWKDVFETKTGKLNANASIEGGKYPFFTCSKDTSYIDTYAFDCEALLLAGNNASANYDVKYYKGKFNAYQRTYVLTIKEGAYPFYKISLEGKLPFLQSHSLGGLTKYLTMGVLKDLSFIAPPLSLQHLFASKIEAIEYQKELIKKSIKEVETLFNSRMDYYFN